MEKQAKFDLILVLLVIFFIGMGTFLAIKDKNNSKETNSPDKHEIYSTIQDTRQN